MACVQVCPAGVSSSVVVVANCVDGIKAAATPLTTNGTKPANRPPHVVESAQWLSSSNTSRKRNAGPRPSGALIRRRRERNVSVGGRRSPLGDTVCAVHRLPTHSGRHLSGRVAGLRCDVLLRLAGVAGRIGAARPEGWQAPERCPGAHALLCPITN